MATYPFTIITPEGTLFEGDVESIVAPGREGAFGVLANHAPLIAGVEPGPLTVRESGGAERFFTVGTGVLEAGDGKVVLLAEDGQKAANLEEAKAAKDDMESVE